MIRRQPWPMYVPSAMTVWRFASGGAMRGRIDQHHAVRLRRARASPVDSDAVRDDAPAAMRGTPPASAPVCGHAAASSSSAGRPGISTVACPCRSVRSSSSHARIPGISSLCWMAFSHHPAHHRERIIFHAGEKDMPTRLLVQGQTSIISTTKVPIGPTLSLLAHR